MLSRLSGIVPRPFVRASEPRDLRVDEREIKVLYARTLVSGYSFGGGEGGGGCINLFSLRWRGCFVCEGEEVEICGCFGVGRRGDGLLVSTKKCLNDWDELSKRYGLTC